MKKTHRHTLNCRSVYKHICENLDADINSAQCREIRAHIARCDNCTAYLDSLKKTVHLYRAYPTPRMPAQSHKKLIAIIALHQSRNTKQQRDSESFLLSAASKE